MTYTSSTQWLHGTEDRSHVFVVRSPHGGSDELQIYDEVDGRLRLRFAFRPRTGGAKSSFTTDVRTQQDRAPVDYLMVQSPIVADVDGDGEREVIMPYRAGRLLANAFRVPLSVGWDDQRQAYAVSATLKYRPIDTLDPKVGTLVTTYRRAFQVADAADPARRPLRAFAVSSLMVLSRRSVAGRRGTWSVRCLPCRAG